MAVYKTLFMVFQGENVRRAWESFQRRPRRSARQHSRILGIGRRLGRILQYISFQSCKTQITQNLFPRDKLSRVEFGNVILGIINEDRDVLNLAF